MYMVEGPQLPNSGSAPAEAVSSSANLPTPNTAETIANAPTVPVASSTENVGMTTSGAPESQPDSGGENTGNIAKAETSENPAPVDLSHVKDLAELVSATDAPSTENGTGDGAVSGGTAQTPDAGTTADQPLTGNEAVAETSASSLATETPPDATPVAPAVDAVSTDTSASPDSIASLPAQEPNPADSQKTPDTAAVSAQGDAASSADNDPSVSDTQQAKRSINLPRFGVDAIARKVNEIKATRQENAQILQQHREEAAKTPDQKAEENAVKLLGQDAREMSTQDRKTLSEYAGKKLGTEAAVIQNGVKSELKVDTIDATDMQRSVLVTVVESSNIAALQEARNIADKAPAEDGKKETFDTQNSRHLIVAKDGDDIVVTNLRSIDGNKIVVSDSGEITSADPEEVDTSFEFSVMRISKDGVITSSADTRKKVDAGKERNDSGRRHAITDAVEDTFSNALRYDTKLMEYTMSSGAVSVSERNKAEKADTVAFDASEKVVNPENYSTSDSETEGPKPLVYRFRTVDVRPATELQGADAAKTAEDAQFAMLEQVLELRKARAFADGKEPTIYTGKPEFRAVAQDVKVANVEIPNQEEVTAENEDGEVVKLALTPEQHHMLDTLIPSTRREWVGKIIESTGSSFDENTKYELGRLPQNPEEPVNGTTVDKNADVMQDLQNAVKQQEVITEAIKMGVVGADKVTQNWQRVLLLTPEVSAAEADRLVTELQDAKKALKSSDIPAAREALRERFEGGDAAVLDKLLEAIYPQTPAERQKSVLDQRVALSEAYASNNPKADEMRQQLESSVKQLVDEGILVEGLVTVPEKPQERNNENDENADRSQELVGDLKGIAEAADEGDAMSLALKFIKADPNMISREQVNLALELVNRVWRSNKSMKAVENASTGQQNSTAAS